MISALEPDARYQNSWLADVGPEIQVTRSRCKTGRLNLSLTTAEIVTETQTRGQF